MKNTSTFHMPDGFDHYCGYVRHAESAAYIFPHPARIVHVADCMREIKGELFYDLVVFHQRADGPSDLVIAPWSWLTDPRFWQVVNQKLPDTVSHRYDLVAAYWRGLIVDFMRSEGVAE